MKLPFPAPSELWGDYKIKSWSRTENGLFAVNLQILASAIVYTNKEVTDRVNTQVREIIQGSKDELINSSEALESLSVQRMFSIEEWSEINKTAKEQGRMMGDFFRNNHIVN